MKSIDVARELQADAAAVWDALIDTTCWGAWGPTVRGADLESTPATARGPATTRIGPAARGRVHTVAGLSLPFEITEWEEGRRWAWRVGGIPATGHRVESVADPSRCHAVIEVPVWAAAYGPLCWLALGRLGRVAASRPSPTRHL